MTLRDVLRLVTLGLLLAAPAGAAKGPALAAGDAAPSMALPAPGGGEISLESLRGKVVLVNFWASWCAPCMKEMPLLDALNARSADRGMVVLAVNVDQRRDAGERVIERLGLTLPVAFDTDNQLVSAFGPGSMPTSYLIDPEGQIRAVYDGSVDDEELAAIEQAMAGLVPQ